MSVDGSRASLRTETELMIWDLGAQGIESLDRLAGEATDSQRDERFFGAVPRRPGHSRADLGVDLRR